MSRYDKNSWFRWTEERLQYLLEVHHCTSNAEIAKTLGTNVTAVLNKAHTLGLHKDKSYSDSVRTENCKPYRFVKGWVISQEAKEKRDATNATLLKRERLRLRYGLPQLTKKKIVDIYKD